MLIFLYIYFIELISNNSSISAYNMATKKYLREDSILKRFPIV